MLKVLSLINSVLIHLEKERKVYAVRRHDGSLCTEKQPELYIYNFVLATKVNQLDYVVVVNKD